ncbi:MAG: RelA/SpoT family protein [Treponema sp.]|nr:RelA/SpoT family protein [Treponema sp.]
MSKISVFTSDENNPDALLQEFFQTASYFEPSEIQLITRAWTILVEKSADKKRLSGEPFYLHPLRVALILAQKKLDCCTIIAAILHSAHELNFTQEQAKEIFGDSVYNIICTTNKILNLPINAKTLHQADSIRNMFFAMSDDVRIILITLADRLDRIRNLNIFIPDTQKIVAESVIEIWAPLADRMGMQQEKNELEDLSLKYLNPAAFQQIKSIVAQKKDERASYLNDAVSNILKAAEKLNLQIEVESRAKHFYSIYQKMRKRNKEISELYDLLALRILCNTTTDCYTVIGIVHGLWKPLDGRFKDYIAMPKSNGYQSLHTTVMCQGKPLEIQIRTHKMHEKAEHGVASHWLYKKGTNKDLVEEDKLEIINKMQSLTSEAITDANYFKTLKHELLGDAIYVFTPAGDVIQLPEGSTAIDFAYSIHSAIGEKIIAAKADGKIIPLSKPLQNTQIIEVITNPNSHPTEAQLKLVKTSRAHQRIHSWLSTNEPTFSGYTGAQKNESAEIPQDVQQKKKRPKPGKLDKQLLHHENRRILIQGEKNVLYNIAQCCKPEYPDLISGYVTRTKGISVHRTDCLIYQRIPYKDERSVEVKWED